MKKLVLILMAGSFLFTACSKEDDPGTTSANPTGAESTTLAKVIVPSTFTQKLLMEMYATSGCATCPDAETKADNYAAANPDKVYSVNVHTSDAMTSPQFAYLDGLLNVTVFSSGSFNRLPFNGAAVLHKTTWNKTVISTCLTKTAATGLMINTTKSGSNGTATVTAGFNKSLSGNHKLTVYLVEDNVTGTGTGYNQANYYNNIATSPFYQLGNPIIGYKHGFVLRKVLSASTGDAIPATSINTGGSYSKTYSFNTTGYNASNLYVIAFVNKPGSTPVTQQILNVQRVKYGSNKSWD